MSQLDPTTVLAPLWRASWQAGILALLVLGLRYTLRDRLPAAWRARLWTLVFLRLLLPAVPSSPVSLFNLLPPDPPTANWPVLTVLVHAAPTHAADLTQDSAAPPLAAPRSHWPEAVLATWLTVAAALATATVAAHIRFARRVRRSQQPVASNVAAMWHDVTAGRRVPPLVVTDAVTSPALFGLVRGRLLLPPNLWDRLSPGELQLVLRHEFAHVRRRDLAVGSLATLLRCVYWFHPLAWIAVAAWRTDAELACDDAVVTTTGDRVAYGRTLLAVAGGPRVPTLGMADGRTDLRRRLSRIATGRRPGRGSVVIAALLTVAVGCATLTGTSRPSNVTKTYGRLTSADQGVATMDEVGQAASLPSTAALIRQSVSPNLWGHDGTSIVEEGKVVRVTAPAAVQEQVERLLNAKRVQVVVESRVVTLRPSQVRAAGLDVSPPDVVCPITIEGLDRLIRAIDRDPKAASVAAPKITLFDGQRGVLIVETPQAYVSAQRPVVDATTARFEPSTSTTVTQGIVVNVSATVTSDRSAVDLSSHVQVAQLVSMEPVEVTAHAPNGATTRATYQVPHGLAHVADSAGVRVPSGGLAWVRSRPFKYQGPSTPPTSMPYQSTDPDEPETFVIWKATVLVPQLAGSPMPVASPSTAPAVRGKPSITSDVDRYARPDERGPFRVSDDPGMFKAPVRPTIAGPYPVTPDVNAVPGFIPVATLTPSPETPTPDGRGVAIPVPTDVPVDSTRLLGTGPLGTTDWGTVETAVIGKRNSATTEPAAR